MAMRTQRTIDAKRKRRRATIANKENIPCTSTPMVPRLRNSPLVLTPLADILNVTPESRSTRSNERRRIDAANYASTLPKYEEEYSPSTVLPTGQQLALRGLLPDPFLGNPRYFTTPELTQQQRTGRLDATNFTKSLPKRNLEQEFVAIAKEQENSTKITPKVNATNLHSSKMGDQTLDHLIDAILESARKDEKKKKTRKSFNLRRRTLLKNQAENMSEVILSPSYAAGDDPASDLTFLLIEPVANTKSFTAVTPKISLSSTLSTPDPATPLPGTPISDVVLCQMPTPLPRSISCLRRNVRNDSTNTFKLETPVKALTQKRRRRVEEETEMQTVTPKKSRVDAKNYFEIGVALPSIYV
ncbi:uncharacterized protein LOC119669702 [Teleopsis dalmanni]|uniref:uncharacterized protein LOC119669702 n=1 Tax=Teleopsis dalmanni TaxID=139649 RepID=UPI0018CEB585|nr:uncharacterized protein LOC119669702 [Teleopsis dalmanni]